MPWPYSTLFEGVGRNSLSLGTFAVTGLWSLDFVSTRLEDRISPTRLDAGEAIGGAALQCQREFVVLVLPLFTSNQCLCFWIQQEPDGIDALAFF